MGNLNLAGHSRPGTTVTKLVVLLLVCVLRIPGNGILLGLPMYGGSRMLDIWCQDMVP